MEKTKPSIFTFKSKNVDLDNFLQIEQNTKHSYTITHYHMIMMDQRKIFLQKKKTDVSYLSIK